MMQSELPDRRQNRILDALDPGDRIVVAKYLEPVVLGYRQRLEVADRPVKRVYFIEAGLASVVAASRQHDRQAEVAIVGFEGMTGMSVILNGDQAPHDIFMQVAGSGRSISAENLQTLMRQSRSLMNTLLRYVQAFTIQTAHTALSNAKGTIHERLARWLLMAHDRVPGDQLHLTHEFLALVLGVRRAGVTIALQEFESRGVLSVSRGRLDIKDRGGLESSANGFYGIPEVEMNRLFPPRTSVEARKERNG